MRVAVVGAGVLGASVAWALVRGDAEVTLVERAGTGTGTSALGAGLVCEGMWHPTSLALVRRSIDLLRALSEEGDGVAFHPVGSSTLVPDALVPAVRRLAQRQRTWGADVRILSPAEARDLPLHGHLRLDDAAEVVHYPRDGWALPRRYAERLVELAVREGMTVRAGEATLRQAGEGVALAVDGEPVGADAVVVAAGIRTRGILQGAGLDAPLAAYRTQAVPFLHPQAHEVPLIHDAVRGFYLRPGPPGQLLAGNGTTTAPENPEHWRRDADPGFLDTTRQRLHHRLPAFADGRLAEGWAGLDAATPDRLLLAGPHPDAAGIWLLAGGNGHGFMRAPGAGEALAARILGKPAPVDLSAYDPARFRDRMGEPFAIREGFTLDTEEAAPHGGAG